MEPLMALRRTILLWKIIAVERDDFLQNDLQKSSGSQRWTEKMIFSKYRCHWKKFIIPFRSMGILEKGSSLWWIIPIHALYSSFHRTEEIHTEVGPTSRTQCIKMMMKKCNSTMENIRRILRQRHDITDPDDDDFPFDPFPKPWKHWVELQCSSIFS